MTLRTHLGIPTFTFVLLAIIFSTTSLDITIAHRLFFDPLHGQWLGQDNWWLNEVVHTGGRWAIRLIVLVAVVLWALANERCEQLHEWRLPLAFFIVSVMLSIGIVGLLKVLTNVDCPWDLSEFGGRYPFVHLFADRPDALRRAQCFPAAHASSGYALLSLYFMFRERSVALARWGLGLGVAMGLLFGFAQQARGAHFMSHDLWSAFLVWMVCYGTYMFLFRQHLWSERSDTVAPTRLQVRLDESCARV